jgi:hypothetical protein
MFAGEHFSHYSAITQFLVGLLSRHIPLLENDLAAKQRARSRSWRKFCFRMTLANSENLIRGDN